MINEIRGSFGPTNSLEKLEKTRRLERQFLFVGASEVVGASPPSARDSMPKDGPPKRQFLKRGEGISRFESGGLADARSQYLERHPPKAGGGSRPPPDEPPDEPPPRQPPRQPKRRQEAAWATATVLVPSAPPADRTAPAAIDDQALLPLSTKDRRLSAEANVTLDEFEALEATVREQADAMVHVSGLGSLALSVPRGVMRPASAASSSAPLRGGGTAAAADAPSDEEHLYSDGMGDDEDEEAWVEGYEDEEDAAAGSPSRLGLPPALPNLPPAPAAPPSYPPSYPPSNHPIIRAPTAAAGSPRRREGLSPEQPGLGARAADEYIDDLASGSVGVWPSEAATAAVAAAVHASVAAEAAEEAEAAEAEAEEAAEEEGEDEESLSWSLSARAPMKYGRGGGTHEESGSTSGSQDLWSSYSIFNQGGVGAGGAGSNGCVGGQGDEGGHESTGAAGGTFLFADYDDDGYGGYGGYGAADAPATAPIDPNEPPPVSRLVSSLFKPPAPAPNLAPAKLPNLDSKPPSAVGRGAGACAAGRGAPSGGRGGAPRAPPSAPAPSADPSATAAEEETRRLRRKVQQLSEQLAAAVRATEEAEALLLQQMAAAAGGASGAAAMPLSLADAASLQSEREQFEAYKVEEGRKLLRERRVVERQAKALLKVPDRKEREEVDGLKAELAAARKEMQVRDARWKMTAERLKKTAQTAEAKVAELAAEVAYLEKCRVHGWTPAGPNPSHKQNSGVAAGVVAAAGAASSIIRSSV